MCYQDENKSVNCPVCMPVLSELAETLPFSHRLHSSLVCRMSGELISDHNPPMVLPNGFVYGQKVYAVGRTSSSMVLCAGCSACSSVAVGAGLDSATSIILFRFSCLWIRCNWSQALMEAAEKHNGSVVCPRSGAVFKYSDAKKIFIM